MPFNFSLLTSLNVLLISHFFWIYVFEIHLYFQNTRKSMSQIRSESKFVWKFLLYILLTPVTFIQVLFGKKRLKEIFKPFRELWLFIIEPKFTLSIIIANIVFSFFCWIFLSEAGFNTFVNYPADFLSGRIFTLITSGFMHGNLVHLFGNMLGIFIFGRVVEKKLGPAKTAFVYFGALIISGLFNSVIHVFFLNQNIGGIGASGALMGLISAAILLWPFYITYELIIPLPIMLCGWFFIYLDISGILTAVDDGIGHFAHLGGFLSIALLLFFFGGEDKNKLKKGLMINLASLGVFAIVYFVFFA
jgi:membrane associated rhomboid family serine protease